MVVVDVNPVLALLLEDTYELSLCRIGNCNGTVCVFEEGCDGDGLEGCEIFGGSLGVVRSIVAIVKLLVALVKLLVADRLISESMNREGVLGAASTRIADVGEENGTGLFSPSRLAIRVRKAVEVDLSVAVGISTYVSFDTRIRRAR